MENTQGRVERLRQGRLRASEVHRPPQSAARGWRRRERRSDPLPVQDEHVSRPLHSQFLPPREALHVCTLAGGDRSVSLLIFSGSKVQAAYLVATIDFESYL